MSRPSGRATRSITCTSAVPSPCAGTSPNDRRFPGADHPRRSLRHRQVQRGPGRRPQARCRLPRHRRHVPGRDRRRARRGRQPGRQGRRRAGGLAGRDRGRHQRASRGGQGGRRRRPRAHPRRRGHPCGVAGVRRPRGPPAPGRPAARAGGRGRRGRRGGPRHRHRRPAGRDAEDLPDRLTRRPRPAPGGPARRHRAREDRRPGAGPAAPRRARQPSRRQPASPGGGRDRRRQHRPRPRRRRRAHPRTGRLGRGSGGAGMSESTGPLPVVAIVGRPNVGKSTLVNRILGRRAAVVQDIPGVTRDRISYEALWNGKRFTLVDTGGWDPKATGVGASITRQAEYAMQTADVIVLVVDSSVGATDTDLAAARILRGSDRPVILVANKVDDERSEAGAAELWSLGLGEPQAVSALHGRSSGDLLDLILDALPEAPREQLEEGGPRRVALVGRPNVGKSSLLNRLAKDERSVVDSVAGTTVDPVDSIVVLGGEDWRFVDTAGLRRKVNTASGTEYYASLRTEAAIQAAEVAVVLLAADEVISEQDQRVISQVVDAGRALVIAINKWDTLDEDRHYQLEKEIERELARVRWASRVNISAATGRGVGKLADHLRSALESWEKRIPTAELNQFIRQVVQETPPPARGGRAPKIKYVTQADVRPPRFVVFSPGFLEAGYRRFLERKLREHFGFAGTPIEISVKVREGRDKDKRG